MLLQSSPKMGPAVQVESPKSPPRTFFNRSQSRSPERIDTTPFAKVRDLVSQHSSRSSSRAATPAVERSEYVPPKSIDEQPAAKPVPSQPRARSPVPPPFNRADKPKIPAKPINITSTSDSSLAARPLAFLNEQKTSPFGSPHSSDEDQPPTDSGRGQELAPRSQDSLGRTTESRKNSTGVSSINTQQSNDARSLGFGSKLRSQESSRSRDSPEPDTSTQSPSVKTTFDRRDPRQLGFSASAPPQPNRDSKHTTPPPARAAPPPIVPVRDARDLGFGSATPTTRQPPTPAQNERPPSPRRIVPTQPFTARDARQFGFSPVTSTPSTPIAGNRPELPQRSAPKIPPPRPSEDSKRPAYSPAIMRPAPTQRVSPQPPAPIPAQARRSEDIPRHTIPLTTDIKYPPPPKRGTINEVDTSRDDSLGIPTPTLSRRRSFDVSPHQDEDSDDAEEAQPEPTNARHDYPDGSQSNRKPPILNPDKWQFHTKMDGKVFDICGRLLCSASYHTRIFDLEAGQELLDLSHGETVKTTAVAFKPGADIKSEGKRIWIGNNLGDLQEIDLETRVTIAHSSAHNKVDIFRILRHQRDLWTLDEAGKLFVWQADETGVPDMKNSPVSHTLLAKPTYAMVVRDTVWVATGKEIRVYRPGNHNNFNVLKNPLQAASGNMDVTCGTYSEEFGRVYIGYIDGRVTIYSLEDYTCLGSMKVSDYRINAMTIVGDKLWAVYKTGKVYVYDISNTPWKVQKDWKAHEGPAASILLNPSSVWLFGRMQVATAGHDGYIRLWDGMLEDDWVEATMHQRDKEYCKLRDVRAAVLTWNCGATNPSFPKTQFIADAIHAHEPDPPEILVFGFQEVIDLEGGTMSAKSLLNFGKKKESKNTDQQYQARVYREWRDQLARCISKYLPQYDYTELHTSSMVGLLSCIFIRANERRNVSNPAGNEVKCGMGGRHGNKGALLYRFVLDSSSLCFVNCHLAAGQSATAHRNNDVATILESDSLPAESDLDVRSSLYVGGGDGRQILDHEICILNGDLNYRIDTMSRSIVIKSIEKGDLTKLLERDQLNVSRRRLAGFRLAPFVELAITFPPTYKYDVGHDRYDTSDKARSPAWCDRLLYRCPVGRVKQLEYIRHEGVYYSDHRPVSGLFKLQIKKVDEVRRKQTLKSVYADFEKMRKAALQEGCVRYLVGSFGITRDEAKSLIKSAK